MKHGKKSFADANTDLIILPDLHHQNKCSVKICYY